MDVRPEETPVERLTRKLAKLERVGGGRENVFDTLPWIQLKQQLAKAQYDRFLELESTDPKQAVKHFYDSRRAFYGPACDHPLKVLAKAERLNLPENFASLEADELFILGLQAYYGIGIECDSHLARICFSEAAKKKHADAEYMLGRLYEDEIVKGSSEVFYQKAAEQGHADAQYRMGMRALNHHDYLKGYEAILWFRRAACQGHPHAQCIVGRGYITALPRANYRDYNVSHAIMWFRPSAAQGNEQAKNYLHNLASNAKSATFEVRYVSAVIGFNDAKDKMWCEVDYSQEIDKLIKEDPNQFLALLQKDKFLDDEMRYPFYEKLLRHQRYATSNDRKLCEADSRQVNLAVATYRFSHLNKKEGIESTTAELEFQRSLLSTIPIWDSRHSKAAEMLTELDKMLARKKENKAFWKSARGLWASHASPSTKAASEEVEFAAPGNRG